MRKHVDFLGLLFILYSLLGLVGAFAIFAFFTGFGVLNGDIENLTGLAVFGAVVAAMFVIVALPGIITGLGLRAHKNWARYIAMILGVINILNFPFGTLLGAYTLYVLLHFDTPKVFRRRPARRSGHRRRASA